MKNTTNQEAENKLITKEIKKMIFKRPNVMILV